MLTDGDRQAIFLIALMTGIIISVFVVTMYVALTGFY
jgi:hypothetical protein